MNSGNESAPGKAVGQAVADALAHGRAQRWREAAHAFVTALQLDPAHALALQGLLECALNLARSGECAPNEPASDARAAGKISFVVCSISAPELERLRADVAARFANDEHELIHIADARSLCDGYNRGLARARGALIVFCHDDIGLLCDDFAARLRRHLAGCDLLGVAGTERLTGPVWSWCGPPHIASAVCMPHLGGLICPLAGARPALPHAQALDGVLLAGRRELFEQLPFDADTFDGFHFYDLDLSYRAFRAGARCTVALDLPIWHASGGRADRAWQEYARRFVAKFPELAPRAAAVPFRPGTCVAERPQLVAPLYGWVTHWLQATAV